MQYIDLRNLLMGRRALDVEVSASVVALSKEELSRQRQEHWKAFIGQILHRESAGTGEEAASKDGSAASSSSSSSSSSGSAAEASSGTGFHTSSRGVFTMLAVLLPQVRVTGLLQAHPGLMGSLFAAAQFRPMFGLTTHLLELILEQAKSEQLTAPRFPVDTPATAAATATATAGAEGEAQTDNTRSRQKQRKDVNKQRLKAKALEAASGVVAVPSASASASSSIVAPSSTPDLNPLYVSQLASWRALWTSHIVSALYSDSAMWRSDVSSCTLSHVLAKLDTAPDALEHLLGAIQAAGSGSGSASMGALAQAHNQGPPQHQHQQRQALELRQLRALVVTLKIARRIGLISSKDLDKRIRRDGEIGQMAVATAPTASSPSTASAAVSSKDAAGDYLPISSSQLFSALLHTDLDLRLDVFEFLCSNLQSAEGLSGLELGLVRGGVAYLLKAGAPPVRAKFVHCVQRCLVRLRDSVQREVREDLSIRDRAAGAPVPTAVPLGPDASDADIDAAGLYPPHLVGVVSSAALVRVAPSFRFFAFLERFLFDSLYPSAPFERAASALELYKVLVETFMAAAPSPSAAAAAAAADQSSSSSSTQKATGTGAGWATSVPMSSEAGLDVWSLRGLVYTRAKTLVLLNLLASNYERVRALAFELLERFPSPLPAFEHRAEEPSSSLVPLLKWALTLCRSPRMRDAEGGALCMKLLFKKYVVQLRWNIDYNVLARSTAAAAAAGDAATAAAELANGSEGPMVAFSVSPSAQESILYFLESLHQFVVFQLGVIEASDISVRYADPNSRVHGSLLLFRLLAAEVPWGFWNRCGPAVANRWTAFASAMVRTLRHVAEVSLSLHIPTNAAAALRGGAGASGTGSASASAADGEGNVNGETQRPSTFINMDCRGHIILPAKDGASSEQTASSGSGGADAETTTTSTSAGSDDFADQHGEQIVVVSSWLAVKEVALSLGEWVCTAPLPSGSASGSSATSSSPFSLADLRSIGSLFFAILACSKHNGVLENAHEGLLGVCSALLESGCESLVSLVSHEWLGTLLAMIAEPWQGDSWIRRSRGIAYCLLAILQAEPSASKQPASEQEVRAILEAAASSGTFVFDASSLAANASGSSGSGSASMLGRCMAQLMRMAQVDTSSVGPVSPVTGLHEKGWQLKVHALNILRAIFRDSCLAVEALPYVAPALQISIIGFAHSSWAVRNSSLITFGALLSKAVRAQVRSNVGGGGGAAAAVAPAAGDADEVSTGAVNVAAAAAAATTGSGPNAGVSKSGMTAVDFFTVFPSLHPFLLEQLVAATGGVGVGVGVGEAPVAASGAQQQALLLEAQHAAALKAKKESAVVNDGSDPADWSSDMHPSLYPVLLLLSRLIPSPSTDDDAAASSSQPSAQLDTHAFLPLIQQCSSHPYYQARFMSAKAVVSLVSVGKLRAYTLGLVEYLVAAGSGAGAGAGVAIQHNKLHGTLLQLDSLLRFHHTESNLLSAADKHALGAALLPKLVGESGARWLSSASRMRCAPVRLLYLQVLELVVEYLEASGALAADAAPGSVGARASNIDPVAADARKQLLWLAAQACEAPASGLEGFEGVGVDGLRAEAAAIVVRSICCLEVGVDGGSNVDLTGLVLALLKDCIDGARPSLATLESLLWSLRRCFQLHPGAMLCHVDMVGVGGVGAWVLREVVVRFAADFATSPKTNHTVLELACNILAMLWKHQREQRSSITASVDFAQHWTHFLVYTSTSVDVAAKSAAFQCLAMCLHMELDCLRSGSESDSVKAAAAAGGESPLRTFLQHACVFLELLESFMDDEQPVLLRYACVGAIQASGLLSVAVSRCGLCLPSGEAGVVHAPMLPPPSWSSPSTCPLATLAVSHRSLRSVLVRLWTAPILHLLQDENESVRVDVSTLVGGLVEHAQAGAGAGLVGADDSEASAAAADEQSPSIHSGQVLVSRVLERTFVYLVSTFGDEPLLARSMEHILKFYTVHFESVYDNASSTKGSMATAAAAAAAAPTAAVTAESPASAAVATPAAASAAAAAAAASFKLFEHEKPNTIVEELILLELAGFHLGLLQLGEARRLALQVRNATSAEELAQTQTRATDAAQTLLEHVEWWSRGLIACVGAASTAGSAAAASKWVGGPTFMEQTFVQIYGHALGVSCALNVVATGRWAELVANCGASAAAGSLLDQRMKALLAPLQELQLPQRASSMHPLLQRALHGVQTLLDRSTAVAASPLPPADSSSSTSTVLSIGFLTHAAAAGESKH